MFTVRLEAQEPITSPREATRLANDPHRPPQVAWRIADVARMVAGVKVCRLAAQEQGFCEFTSPGLYSPTTPYCRNPAARLLPQYLRRAGAAKAAPRAKPLRVSLC